MLSTNIHMDSTWIPRACAHWVVAARTQSSMQTLLDLREPPAPVVMELEGREGIILRLPQGTLDFRALAQMQPGPAGGNSPPS